MKLLVLITCLAALAAAQRGDPRGDGGDGARAPRLHVPQTLAGGRTLPLPSASRVPMSLPVSMQAQPTSASVSRETLPQLWLGAAVQLQDMFLPSPCARVGEAAGLVLFCGASPTCTTGLAACSRPNAAQTQAPACWFRFAQIAHWAPSIQPMQPTFYVYASLLSLPQRTATTTRPSALPASRPRAARSAPSVPRRERAAAERAPWGSLSPPQLPSAAPIRFLLSTHAGCWAGSRDSTAPVGRMHAVPQSSSRTC